MWRAVLLVILLVLVVLVVLLVPAPVRKFGLSSLAGAGEQEHALAAFAASMLVQIHQLARPFASFLASTIFGEEAAEDYQNMAFMGSGKPIYGMNRGTIGFLMNEFHVDQLRERLETADTSVIHPLIMQAVDADGNRHEYPAINEVSLFRESYQAARLRILVDGRERLAD